MKRAFWRYTVRPDQEQIERFVIFYREHDDLYFDPATSNFYLHGDTWMICPKGEYLEIRASDDAHATE